MKSIQPMVTAAILKPALSALLLCGPICILLGMATASQAAVLTGQIAISYTFTNTLTGTNMYASFNVGRFNPALGTLQKVSFSHSNEFSANAQSIAEGGTLIGTIWVDAWDWIAKFNFGVAAPGLAAVTNSVQSRSGSGNYPSYAHTSAVSVASAKIVSPAAVINQYDTNLLRYIGSGTVGCLFYADQTTVITPLPATPAGFTWALSAIKQAGINGFGTSTITVQYEYTPARPTFTQISVANGIIQAALTNVSAGKVVILEGSTNLSNWFPLQTNAAAGPELIYYRPVAPWTEQLFLRARLP